MSFFNNLFRASRKRPVGQPQDDYDGCTAAAPQYVESTSRRSSEQPGIIPRSANTTPPPQSPPHSHPERPPQPISIPSARDTQPGPLTAPEPADFGPVAIAETSQPSSSPPQPPHAAPSYHLHVSIPPPGGIHNSNNADGTFNHIYGNQRNRDNSKVTNRHYEGDKFSGSINDGNVGGRNNTNNIFNRGGASLSEDNVLIGMTAVLDDTEKEIDVLMDRLRYTEQQKLNKRLESIQLVKGLLMDELNGKDR